MTWWRRARCGRARSSAALLARRRGLRRRDGRRFEQLGEPVEAFLPETAVRVEPTVRGAQPDLDSSVWYLRRVVHTLSPEGFWTEVQGERLTSDAVADLQANG